ncbi:MAG: thioredoxin [Bacteroidales bacterium]|nr:thioredoxin [Bacteroidales bacterium]MCF8332938.1 thioredoxin [Bacteroidales bacterium]
MKHKSLFILAILAGLIFSSCSGNETKANGSGDEDKNETSGKPIHLTKETFKTKVMNYEENKKQWVFEGNKPCVIDFYADWCQPCKKIAPIMKDLAKEYEGEINVYKVDTEKQKELARVFGIKSIPSILFCPKDGKPQMTRGVMPKKRFVNIVDELLLKKGGTSSGTKEQGN